MNTLHNLERRERAPAAGFKTVAVVVILGIFVALAEQAPYASQASDGAVVAVPARVDTALPATALPGGLRAHAGEVPPHIEAF